jgi:hypothetical protein
MRRSSVEIALVLALLACAGCGERAAPPAGAPPTAAAPAPPAPRPASPTPRAPRTDNGPARTAALAMGPGSCEQDVPAIQRLPAQGELGVDPHFDRIAVHRDAYKACLLAMVRDATAIADPGAAPARHPYAQGDLAYDLLARIGFIQYGECLPAEVMGRVDATSNQPVYDWLAEINHRRQVLRCLGKRLGA